MWNQNIQVIRRLLKEVRLATPSKKLRESVIKAYLSTQLRKYALTDRQLCKKENEVMFLADTYRTYLQSSRKYKEIIEQYHSKGERTIKQTADMVGFKLPHDK